MSPIRTQHKSDAPRAARRASDPRAAERSRAPTSPRHGFAPVSPRRGLAPANGLPEPLKTNIEAMSGFAMDDVRVHRNSSGPAALGALAFTRGNEIHLGSGQEKHLPHEAWHVVQQKEGRVRPTFIVSGAAVNEDPLLEREADAMGARATSWRGTPRAAAPAGRIGPAAVVQRVTSDQENKLKLRLAKDGIAATSVAYAGAAGSETATIDGKRVYQWIRGHEHWRFKGKVKTEGGSGAFFGRLENSALSMLATTALITAPAETDQWETDVAPINFVPSRSLGGSRATGASMGEFYFGRAAYLSADDYALANGGYEWLHMRADSLGGGVDPENLYAGGGAANSYMAAVEKAVGESNGKGVALGIQINATVKGNHHSKQNGVGIVERVNLRRVQQKQKPFGDEELAHLLAKPSHRLSALDYKVTADGKAVWSAKVSADLPGKFDQGVFDEVKSLVIKSIFGQTITGLSATLNQSATAPVSNTGGASKPTTDFKSPN